MAHNETVFEPDAGWTRALEKYGAATHLAVELYGRDEHLILGPVHPTRLFELLAPGHHTLSMFAACVRRCLTPTAGASPIVVEQRHRFAVIGSSLALNGEVVGAAVAAYVLTAFPDEHAVRRLAIDCGADHPPGAGEPDGYSERDQNRRSAGQACGPAPGRPAGCVSDHARPDRVAEVVGTHGHVGGSRCANEPSADRSAGTLLDDFPARGAYLARGRRHASGADPHQPPRQRGEIHAAEGAHRGDGLPRGE